MAMVINTNMASANAVRLLDSSSKEQSASMERLTSGLRINSAADDAAGLAIATKMTSQISGTEVAIRNANDGISMTQTIDGATEEVVSMMQRMRELGVQSMNETYSTENRSQMDQEYQQLVSEIDRVSETTKFNGLNIMNSAGSLNLQAGWETTANDQIAISTIDMGTDALAAFDTTRVDLGATTDLTNFDNALDTLSVNVGEVALGTGNGVDLGFTYGDPVNGVIIDENTTGKEFNAALAFKINADATLIAADITASVDATTGALTLQSSKNDIAIADIVASGDHTNVAGTANAAFTPVAATGSATNYTGSVAQTDITTTANAKVAVDTIDLALSDLSTYRSETGAKQNRLDHTISNLSSVNENITGARSRIQDADFATESANLARSQVLQQAGMSMLSQANANSQNVLALLQ